MITFDTAITQYTTTTRRLQSVSLQMAMAVLAHKSINLMLKTFQREMNALAEE